MRLGNLLLTTVFWANFLFTAQQPNDFIKIDLVNQDKPSPIVATYNLDKKYLPLFPTLQGMLESLPEGSSHEATLFEQNVPQNVLQFIINNVANLTPFVLSTLMIPGTINDDKIIFIHQLRDAFDFLGNEDIRSILSKYLEEQANNDAVLKKDSYTLYAHKAVHETWKFYDKFLAFREGTLKESLFSIVPEYELIMNHFVAQLAEGSMLPWSEFPNFRKTLLSHELKFQQSLHSPIFSEDKQIFIFTIQDKMHIFSIQEEKILKSYTVQNELVGGCLSRDHHNMYGLYKKNDNLYEIWQLTLVHDQRVRVLSIKHPMINIFKMQISLDDKYLGILYEGGIPQSIYLDIIDLATKNNIYHQEIKAYNFNFMHNQSFGILQYLGDRYKNFARSFIVNQIDAQNTVSLQNRYDYTQSLGTLEFTYEPDTNQLAFLSKDYVRTLRLDDIGREDRIEINSVAHSQRRFFVYATPHILVSVAHNRQANDTGSDKWLPVNIYLDIVDLKDNKRKSDFFKSSYGPIKNVMANEYDIWLIFDKHIVIYNYKNPCNWKQTLFLVALYKYHKERKQPFEIQENTAIFELFKTIPVTCQNVLQKQGFVTISALPAAKKQKTQPTQPEAPTKKPTKEPILGPQGKEERSDDDYSDND